MVKIIFSRNRNIYIYVIQGEFGVDGGTEFKVNYISCTFL